MDTFVDHFTAENDGKLQSYRENIPNFEPSVAPIVTSMENIRMLLDNISSVQKRLGEPCEELCMNCSPEQFNEFLGISIETVKTEKNTDAPSKSQEKTSPLNENDQEAIVKSKENEVRIVPQISETEFKTIPKYQLGRLTLDNLNDIVSRMDDFLMKKSNIFGKTNKQLTRNDRELLDNWRELEMKGKGRLPTTLFFVESDIRPLLQERLRPSFAKAIPCLRHIRRIREERCGPLTFYYP